MKAMKGGGKAPKVASKGPEGWRKMFGKTAKKSEPDAVPRAPKKVGDPTMKGAAKKNANAKRLEGKLI